MKTYEVDIQVLPIHSHEIQYTTIKHVVEAENEEYACALVEKIEQGHKRWTRNVTAKQMFKKEVDIFELIPVHLMPLNCS